MLNIDLSGKIAVVTGATGELGSAMVRTLAECGADTAIHYLQNLKKAKALQKEVESAGVKGLIVQADVTDFDSVIAMRDLIAEKLGDPDIIVNNAVGRHPWKTLMEQPLEDYETEFRTCVMHNVHMAKAFVPGMIKKGGGRIIALNTECAIYAGPNESAYVSGKRGMDGLLRVLVKEIGQHQITVNQVAPGWTISDRDRKAGTERREEYEKTVPLRRRGDDQDIANAVAFLASDLASFISGSFIPVCGGRVMPAI